MQSAAYRPLTAGRHGSEGRWSSGFSGRSRCWTEIALLDLGGQRQRGLLALLLLHANQVVSSSRLIEELWPDEASESHAGALQASVSRLRKSLGPGAELLVTLPTGYVIELAPEQLDLDRFERLVEEAGDAEPQEAAERLREALALWRGPALADFAYEPFAQAAIGRLEEVHLLAVEMRIDADLALGRHAALVAELDALAAEHPLRERLRGQLMLALYRSGRQAEALAAYQTARRVLVDELGIEPSAALQELERAMLRQDPALELAQATAPERSILVAWLGDGPPEPLLAVAEPLARKEPREVIVARLAGRPRRARGRRGEPEGAHRGARGTRGRRAVGRVHERLARSGRLSARGRAGRRPRARRRPGGAARRLRPRRSPALCPVRRRRAHRRRAGRRPGARPLRRHRPRLERDRARRLARGQLAGAAPPRRARRSRAAATRAACSRAPPSPFSARWASPPSRSSSSPARTRSSPRPQDAGVTVVGLSDRWRKDGLGPTRGALAASGHPTLLVRKGLRPGGLAPAENLTRFTWSLRG